MILTKEQIEELERVSEPLIKFLCNPEIFHPHMKVIVDCGGAEILEGKASIKNDKYIVD